MLSTCCAVSAHGSIKHSLNISLSKHRQNLQAQNTASRDWETSCLHPKIYFYFNCPEIFPMCFLEFCMIFCIIPLRCTHTLHSMLEVLFSCIAASCSLEQLCLHSFSEWFSSLLLVFACL